MISVAERDWYTWHHDYDVPGTALARRLAAVQEQIRTALDTAPPGPLDAISLCAGQGRDLIGALAGHPRRDDVSARLVELDPHNAAVARAAAEAAGLSRVEVVTGDAALADQYAGMVPAYLVLVCGVFGNMTDDDVRRTIGYCTQLCARGGTVVWTRGRWEPDLVPQICDWFADRGFELGWVSDPAQGWPERGWPERGWGAGAHRFTAAPVPLEHGARMFTFTGHHPRTGPARDRSLRELIPIDGLGGPVRPAGSLRPFRDPRGDLGPRVEAQLGHDVGHVPGRGGRADGELARDGLVAPAAGHQGGDLVFALGQ